MPSHLGWRHAEPPAHADIGGAGGWGRRLGRGVTPSRRERSYHPPGRGGAAPLQARAGSGGTGGLGAMAKTPAPPQVDSGGAGGWGDARELRLQARPIQRTHDASWHAMPRHAVPYITTHGKIVKHRIT